MGWVLRQTRDEFSRKGAEARKGRTEKWLTRIWEGGRRLGGIFLSYMFLSFISVFASFAPSRKNLLLKCLPLVWTTGPNITTHLHTFKFLPQQTAGKTPENSAIFGGFPVFSPVIAPKVPPRGFFAGAFSAARRGRVAICRDLSAEKDLLPSLPAVQVSRDCI